jgi:hypothetical protein
MGQKKKKKSKKRSEMTNSPHGENLILDPRVL